MDWLTAVVLGTFGPNSKDKNRVFVELFLQDGIKNILLVICCFPHLSQFYYRSLFQSANLLSPAMHVK